MHRGAVKPPGFTRTTALSCKPSQRVKNSWFETPAMLLSLRRRFSLVVVANWALGTYQSQGIGAFRAFEHELVQDQERELYRRRAAVAICLRRGATGGSAAAGAGTAAHLCCA